jgi:Undecaprenyl-phosphate glucose phosphotransferase
MTVSGVQTAKEAIRARWNVPISRGAFDLLGALLEALAVFAVGSATALIALPAGGTVPLFAAALAVGYLILGWLCGLHPHRRSLGDVVGGLSVPRVLGATFVGFALAAAALDPAAAESMVLWLALWFVAALVAVPLVHRAMAAAEARLAFRQAHSRHAVLVGAGPSAMKLLERLADEESDIEFLGFFDDRLTRVEGMARHLPHLGGLEALIDFVADHDDLHIYLALPWTAGPRIAALLDRLRFLPITVWLVPDPELSALSMSHVDGVDGVVMPTLMTPPLSHWDRLTKALFDFVAGSAILLMISPILLATAVAIKLDSPGPVLFRQQRSGQFGRKFSIYKFRSLKVEKADADAERLVSSHDDRVTRVGRFIRKYSIDELPQIFNVLKGEMSLVGPRPHAPKAKADGRLYAAVVPDYAIRYRVKPGMTGWAQINGWRGETDTEEKLRKRVEFDFYYIRNWSFWLDMLILLRTVPAVVLPKNNV